MRQNFDVKGGPQLGRRNLPKLRDAMKAQGYRPVHVDGYTVNGKPYFAAIWDKGRGGWVARHGMSGSQYQAEFDKWAAQGYRLVDVSGYEAGGKARYAAIWHR